MASRQMKMPVKDDAEKLPEADDVFSQRKRPELGRYLLQVDRQTKGSYTTSKAAQAAALVIKTEHPGRSGVGLRKYQHDRGRRHDARPGATMSITCAAAFPVTGYRRCSATIRSFAA